MQPVLCEHLDEADPDEDAGAEGVERANGGDGGRVVAVEAVEHADADGHAERGDERVWQGEEEFAGEGEGALGRDLGVCRVVGA